MKGIISKGKNLQDVSHVLNFNNDRNPKSRQILSKVLSISKMTHDQRYIFKDLALQLTYILFNQIWLSNILRYGNVKRRGNYSVYQVLSDPTI